jgi:hypothetical protein
MGSFQYPRGLFWLSIGAFALLAAIVLRNHAMTDDMEDLLLILVCHFACNRWGPADSGRSGGSSQGNVSHRAITE